MRILKQQWTQSLSGGHARASGIALIGRRPGRTLLQRQSVLHAQRLSELQLCVLWIEVGAHFIGGLEQSCVTSKTFLFQKRLSGAILNRRFS